LTAVQQMTDTVRAANAHLFPPHATYRFRPGTVPVTMSDDPTAGQNPPYGAAINYYLKDAPSSDVKIRIEDARGQTVRTITGTKNVGLNRISWDLRGEPSKEMRLRTSPAYAPEIRVGSDGTRTAPDGARITLLMPPGTYTVKLSAGGNELSQPLVVLKDPSSSGTEADIQSQFEMLTDVRKDLESATETVNQIESLRAQLTNLIAVMQGEANAPLRKSADDLDKKLIEIEDNLIQRKLTGQGQDTVRWPPKLVSKISYVASGLSGADFPPTNQQREVHALLKAQLATHRAKLRTVVETDVAAFNKLLRDKGVGNIVTP